MSIVFFAVLFGNIQLIFLFVRTENVRYIRQLETALHLISSNWNYTEAFHYRINQHRLYH